MRDPRPYSRRVLDQLFQDWSKSNRRVLSAAAAVIIVAVAVLTVVMVVVPDDPGALSWYLLGVSHAALIASLVFAVHYLFIVHSPRAIHHVRGAWGEDNTRSELARAKRKGVIWGWVDSVPLQTGDIDHVVVTRRAGVVAIDSKWRSSLNPKDAHDLARAANSARVRTDGIARTVLSSEHGEHRARVRPVQVRSVIALWGANPDELPHGGVDGVPIVTGREIVPWLRQLRGDPVDEDAAKELIRLVEGHSVRVRSRQDR